MKCPVCGRQRWTLFKRHHRSGERICDQCRFWASSVMGYLICRGYKPLYRRISDGTVHQ
jgi:hypothetical protein